MTPLRNQTEQAIPVRSIDPGMAAKAVFNGHRIQIASGRPRDLINNIQQADCGICFTGLEISAVRPATVLGCYHAYHKACMDEALKTSSKCPVCRVGPDQASLPITADSPDALKAMLPVECAGRGCLVKSREQAATYQCPYPVSTFEKTVSGYWALGQFMEHNHQAMVSWLGSVLAQNGYSGNINYIETMSVAAGYPGKPAIVVNINSGPGDNYLQLYYSSEDINKGGSAEACFEQLLPDVTVDLMMLRLLKRYPAIFDHSSELYITGWSYPKNEININGSVSPLSLTTILDLAGKAVKWDGLKSELQRVGLEHDKLCQIKAPPSLSSGYSVGFSNPPCVITTDQYGNPRYISFPELRRQQEAARATMPQGQEILPCII